MRAPFAVVALVASAAAGSFAFSPAPAGHSPADLLKRIDALEKQVAQLKADSPLHRQGSDVVLESKGQLILKAANDFQVSAHNLTLKAGGMATLEGGSVTAVRGPILKLNDGARPVMVIGQAASGTVFAP